MKSHGLHLYDILRDCGEIGAGSGYDCNNPLQGGADPNVILINFNDWGQPTYGSTPNLITGISLVNGKSAYKYEGFGRSVTPQVEAIKAGGSGQTLAKHQVTLFIFSRSQLTKNEIQKMFVGSFIAIVRAKAKTADAFEVFGLDSGLYLSAGVLNQLNENNGAYSVTLATQDGDSERKLPQTIYDGTSFDTTKVMIDNTLYMPSILNLTDTNYVAAGGDAVIVTGKNFYGGGAASAISSVKWVNQATMAETTQTSVTVSSDTTLNFATVALTAGTYKLKVTTTKGVAYANVNCIVT